jgi:hypothetical protein
MAGGLDKRGARMRRGGGDETRCASAARNSNDELANYNDAAIAGLLSRAPNTPPQCNSRTLGTGTARALLQQIAILQYWQYCNIAILQYLQSLKMPEKLKNCRKLQENPM